MSVISRLHSIPQQRAGSAIEPAASGRQRRAQAPDAAPSRSRMALLVTGAAVVAAGAGAGAYVVLDDEPAAVTTTVDVPGSVLSRDAAVARRGLDARLATETRRDAAAASRFASR